MVFYVLTKMMGMNHFINDLKADCLIYEIILIILIIYNFVDCLRMYL